VALIDDCERSTRSDRVHKLASLPLASINSILIRRGISPANVEETAALLLETGSPFTATQMVENSFKRHDERALPFGFGRFGDGTEYPVYYSALDEETCIEEVRHHTKNGFEQLLSGQIPYPRYCQFLTSTFNGVVIVLCGQETVYPQLVSVDQSGYPFCQSLARQARERNSLAFHAPSARHDGGVCVPVFARRSLSNHTAREYITFRVHNGQVEHATLAR
jgi:hypothetical protein